MSARPALSAPFRDALTDILSELAKTAGTPIPRDVALGKEHATRIAATLVEIPVRYEVHWRRFGTVPTDLVRDIAYLVRRDQRLPGEDEADWRVFAEVFVRDQLLSHD